MQPVVTDRVVWTAGRSVCLSACGFVSRSVTLMSTDRDAVWVEDSGGPKEPCVRWGPDLPMGRGIFEGGRGIPLGHSAVICAKTAEPFQMPFVLWARMGRRNHVLDGGPAVLRDVAMTTNFGAKIAINWLCVNGSD